MQLCMQLHSMHASNFCIPELEWNAKKRFFSPTLISRQLATGKGSRSVLMCLHYFRADTCVKDVVSSIGWSDTEVVSLLPQPNSPHSPLPTYRIQYRYRFRYRMAFLGIFKFPASAKNLHNIGRYIVGCITRGIFFNIA